MLEREMNKQKHQLVKLGRGTDDIHDVMAMMKEQQKQFAGEEGTDPDKEEKIGREDE